MGIKELQKCLDESADPVFVSPSVRKRFAFLSGLAAALITGLALGWPQIPKERHRIPYQGKGVDPGIWTTGEAGWPLTHSCTRNDGVVGTEHHALYVNLTLAALLILGTGIGTARVVWHWRWPPQFPVRALFSWTLSIAVIICVVQFYLQLPGRHDEQVPSYVTFVALLALSLTVFTAAETIVFLAQWSSRVVRKN